MYVKVSNDMGTQFVRVAAPKPGLVFRFGRVNVSTVVAKNSGNNTQFFIHDEDAGGVVMYDLIRLSADIARGEVEIWVPNL